MKTETFVKRYLEIFATFDFFLGELMCFYIYCKRLLAVKQFNISKESGTSSWYR